jgi:NADH-quinone oxidoreductase subunit A
MGLRGRGTPLVEHTLPGDRSDMQQGCCLPAVTCYSDAMPSGYIPILIFLSVAILFPIVTIVVAKLIRPSAPFATKLEAYECGIKAASDSRGRYTVRFYIIAILFVIFDVETIFLFPWAVRYRLLSWFGVWEVAVFLAILVVGYIWAYKKGALEWV